MVILRALPLLATSLLTAAVFAQNPVTANIHYQESQRYYAEGELSAAVIELKNALHADRTSVSALTLMGKIMLEVGDFPAAEFAFENANTISPDNPTVWLLLAESKLKMNDFRALDAMRAPAKMAIDLKAELSGYRALARLGLDDARQALGILEQSIVPVESSRMLSLARCHYLLDQAQFRAALEQARETTVRYPDFARGWQCLGASLKAIGEPEEAVDAFGRAVKLDAHLLQSAIARAALLISLDRIEEASAQIGFLDIHYPDSPYAAELKARFEELSGNGTAAMEAYRHVTVIYSKMDQERVAASASATMAAARAHLKFEEIESARAYLEAFNILDKTNIAVNSMLAQLLVQAWEPVKAVDVIEPLLEIDPGNIELLKLQARALQLLGKSLDAKIMLQRATALSARNLEPALINGLLLINKGEIERGARMVENSIAQSGLPEQPAFDLASAHAMAGRYDESLVLATFLAKTYPDNVIYRNFTGSTLMDLGRHDRAAAELEKATQIDPDNAYTQVNLARLESSRGEISKARSRLLCLVESHGATNRDALYQLALLEQRQGELMSAIEYAERAAEIASGWLEIQIFLANLYIEAGLGDKAIALIEDATAIGKDHVEFRFRQADVLIRLGEIEQARIIYKLMKRKSLFDPDLLLRVAQAQISIGAWADADNTLLALDMIPPENKTAKMMHVRVLIEQEFHEAAVELSEALITRYPEDGILLMLRADARCGLGQLAAAEKDYSKAFHLSPENPKFLANGFKCFSAAGDEARAMNLIRDPVLTGADNTILGYLYIEESMEQQQWSEAQLVIQQYLARDPANPVLLNNLAHVRHQLGFSDALGYARQARQLAPGIPQINDTLGWILVEQGNAGEGAPFLAQAADASPDSPGIQYHLAMALLALGQSDEAIARLQRALALEKEGFWEAPRAEAALTEELDRREAAAG